MPGQYRELRQQVESDPELPSGVSSMIGGVVGKVGVGLVRQIPVAGIAVDFLGEENLVQTATALTSYLAQRLGSNDEVRLVLQPTELITPLFLQDISRIATENQVIIGFDTFEKTAGALDAWLRRILEGEYGDLHADVLLIISGRDKLDSAWTDYMGIVHSISLGILSEPDARHLLANRGISDEKIVDLILKLSGRIPLWLATLASQVPVDGEGLSDPTDQAIECFLKWVTNEDQRRAAILCALPERLDRDVVSVLLGSEKSAVLFEWLKTQPFVEKKAAEGWAYHEVVRIMMLRHLRNESRAQWDDLSTALGDFFASRRDGMALAIPEAFDNDDWLTLDVSSLFHKLCSEPKSGIGTLAEKLVSAIPREFDYARRLGEAAKEAGLALEDPAVKSWGEQIVRAVDAGLSGNAEPLWLALLDRIEEVLPKESPKRFELILERIRLLEASGRQEAALGEANRAIALDPKNPELLLRRASTLRMIKSNDAALADYSHAADLTPNLGKALIERAGLLECLDRMDEALHDATTAIDREPENIRFLEVRARMREENGLISEAMADRSRAIELQPQGHWPWIDRARMFTRVGEPEKALADYDQALLAEPEDFIAGWRADLLFEIERYDDALAGYAHAIELRDQEKPESKAPPLKIGDEVRFVGRRDFEGSSARVLQTLGKYEDALVQFSHAIDRGDAEEKALYLHSRACLLEQLERSGEALDDKKQALLQCNIALEMIGDRPDLLTRRGKLLQEMGNKEGSLRDYSRVVEIEPGRPIGWGLRSEVLAEMGKYEDALRDFQRAYELEPNRDSVWDKHMTRLLSYVGRYEEALEFCQRALAAHPTDWQVASQVAVMLTLWKGRRAAGEALQKARVGCEAALRTEHVASAHYALATLSAVENNIDSALGHLKKALASSGKLAWKARRDVAFIDFRGNPDFLAILGDGVFSA